MKHARLLVGLIISTIVFGNQLAIAQNIEDISSQANKFTIRISGSETGSGVIIEKNNNIYTAITNWHVVDTQGLYKVITFDNQEYSVTNIQRLTGLDIAIIQFTSDQTYPIVERGDSSEIREGSTVYIIGWADPAAGIYSERTFQFLKADVISRLRSSKDGYAIVHDNPAIPGTSGGPVIDTDARLVAINGESKTEPNTGKQFGRGIPLQDIVAARIDSVVPQEETFPMEIPIDLIPSMDSDPTLTVDFPLEPRDSAVKNSSSTDHQYTLNNLFDDYQKGIITWSELNELIGISCADYPLFCNSSDSTLILGYPESKDSADDAHNELLSRFCTNANHPFCDSVENSSESDSTFVLNGSSESGDQVLANDICASNPFCDSVENSSESDFTLALNGSLELGDQVLASDNSIYNQYIFDGQVGQRVTITLESSDFDTYLAVFTPDNKLLEENDDISQTNSNSEITITLPQTGTYRVIINSYDSKGRGKYELKINFLE